MIVSRVKIPSPRLATSDNQLDHTQGDKTMAKNNQIKHITLHVPAGDAPATVSIVRSLHTNIYPLTSQKAVANLSTLLRVAMQDFGYFIVDQINAGEYGGYIYYCDVDWVKDADGNLYNPKWNGGRG